MVVVVPAATVVEFERLLLDKLEVCDVPRGGGAGGGEDPPLDPSSSLRGRGVGSDGGGLLIFFSRGICVDYFFRLYSFCGFCGFASKEHDRFVDAR